MLILAIAAPFQAVKLAQSWRCQACAFAVNKRCCASPLDLPNDTNIDADADAAITTKMEPPPPPPPKPKKTWCGRCAQMGLVTVSLWHG